MSFNAQHFYLLLISFPNNHPGNPILLQISRHWLSFNIQTCLPICNTSYRAFSKQAPMLYELCYSILLAISFSVILCSGAFFMHFVVKFIFTQLTNSDYFKRDLQPFYAIILPVFSILFHVSWHLLFPFVPAASSAVPVPPLSGRLLSPLETNPYGRLWRQGRGRLRL